MEKVIVDCSTGETTIVPLTAEEIAQAEADAVKAEADRQAAEAEAQAKIAEKQAIAERLGLSAEELATLLS